MKSLGNESPVWVLEGYMDCQGRLTGQAGRVLARVRDRYLVKVLCGDVLSCTAEELLPLPESARATLI